MAAVARWAKEQGYNTLVSWSDNRWSAGQVYETLGFMLAHENFTDYGYVKLNTHQWFHKQTQQKQKTGCPPEFTEYEWATHRGFARIWDCGHKRWELKL